MISSPLIGEPKRPLDKMKSAFDDLKNGRWSNKIQATYVKETTPIAIPTAVPYVSGVASFVLHAAWRLMMD